MTRATQVTQAVSAIRKARASPPAAPEPALMTFLIEEDNGGQYHWILVGDDGELLVRSAGFESHERAEHAARIVRRGASRASFEPTLDPREAIELPDRGDAVAGRDHLEAERGPEAGGDVDNVTVPR